MSKIVKSKRASESLGPLMTRIGVGLHYFAQTLPSEHKLLIGILQDGSKVAAVLDLKDTYAWCVDMGLIFDAMVATKLVTHKNKLSINDIDKQTIRELNAQKRGIKFDLEKAKRLSGSHSNCF